MTSRVETVADALMEVDLAMPAIQAMRLAEAAIEANDAWILPDDVSDATRQKYLNTIAAIERLRPAIAATREADQ